MSGLLTLPQGVWRWLDAIQAALLRIAVATERIATSWRARTTRTSSTDETCSRRSRARLECEQQRKRRQREEVNP